MTETGPNQLASLRWAIESITAERDRLKEINAELLEALKRIADTGTTDIEAIRQFARETIAKATGS